MTYSTDWQSIHPFARKRAVEGASNRFRVWQFVRANGTDFTQREVAQRLGMHRMTVSGHLSDLGIKLKKQATEMEDLFDLETDSFMARPSDGLTLNDVVQA